MLNIKIEQVDAFNYKADILVLKYAQSLLGLDRAVVQKLKDSGKDIENFLPPTGKEFIVEEGLPDSYSQLLFIGVKDLSSLTYLEIEEFVYRAFKRIATLKALPQTIVFTLHGKGFGLDPRKAFLAELDGIQRAAENSILNTELKEIVFVEKDKSTAEILDLTLKDFKENNKHLFLSIWKLPSPRIIDALIAALTEENLFSVSYLKNVISDISISLEQENEVSQIISFTKRIYISLTALEEKENMTLKKEQEKIEFLFTNLNPVYLELMSSGSELKKLEYTELANLLELHGINYLISLCKVRGLNSDFFLRKKEELSSLIKKDLLNFFGTRLIAKGKFPWELVGKIINSPNTEEHWKKLVSLDKKLIDHN